MSKKSLTYMEEYYSNQTQKCYNGTVKKYEKFHGMTMDELIDEAIKEQRERVPEDMVKLYDRLIDFRDDLCKSMKYNSVVSNFSRICKIYRMNRVRIPILPPVNKKRIKSSTPIEYEDILTKQEIRMILDYMNPEERIRAMCMASGGFATQEADNLKREQFYLDLYPYHQSNDYNEAMDILSKRDDIIWVTKLYRQKTGKPYYGLVNPETVQAIAQVRRNDEEPTGKLFDVHMKTFSKKCRDINQILGLGYIDGRGRLTTHSFRRFHATHIRGVSLSYEEQLKVSEVDELQGRGKTKTQEAYMKTNRLHQKLIYAKAMNNVSLFNQYEYEIVDDDVIVHRIDTKKKMKHLQDENEKLRRSMKYSNDVSPELSNLIKDMGKDKFIEELSNIMDGL